MPVEVGLLLVHRSSFGRMSPPATHIQCQRELKPGSLGANRNHHYNDETNIIVIFSSKKLQAYFWSSVTHTGTSSS